jgi:Xaa-Pro dipeptidase
MSDSGAYAYAARREKAYKWMEGQGIDIALFEDTEGRRDSNLRYFSGQPTDALLFLSVTGKSLLVPWDVNMAAKRAHVDEVADYSKFKRSAASAVRATLEHFNVPRGGKLELPPVTPFPLYQTYGKELAGFELVCRNDGIHRQAEKWRAVKDEAELAVYRKCFDISNDILSQIISKVQDGSIKTELDAALFIEAESRRQGCDGPGFETLAAGPGRSFAIHCNPVYTAGPFASAGQKGRAGLSILDWGVSYQGYTSDITVTFVRGKTSAKQEKLISLVEKAARDCFAAMKCSVKARDVGLLADRIFAAGGCHMPHSLGHGIGLDVHESPTTSSREENKDLLEPGMLVTLEPGLYDSGEGGVRLENDVLITGDGPQLMTQSRIVRLD